MLAPVDDRRNYGTQLLTHAALMQSTATWNSGTPAAKSIKH